MGTVIGYRGAKRLTREELRELLDRSRWGRILSTELLERSDGRTGVVVGLTRLAPQVPFALGNLVGAAAAIPFLPFLLGTVVGMLPRMSAVIWVGAELSLWQPGVPLPPGLAVATGAGVVGLLLLALWSGFLLRRYSSAPPEALSEAAPAQKID